MKYKFENKGTFYLILSFVFQSGTVLIGKKASMQMIEFDFHSVLFNSYYWGVIVFLGFQAITWQITLKYYPLSIAYFYMSGVYAIILIGSYFIYDENISWSNLLGVLVIIIGIYILSKKNGKQIIIFKSKEIIV